MEVSQDYEFLVNPKAKMDLNLEKLSISRELFEPYGDIISKGMENNKFLINQGYCERFDEVATVQVLDKKANPIIFDRNSAVLYVTAFKPTKLIF